LTAYFEALCEAMALCGKRADTIFLGQGVASPSTAMSPTFRDVPADKRLEMPVAEDLQMGMAIGMALDGLLPICVYPRWNFLLLAANQMINHLDRIPLYSRRGYQPKVIIRVAAPSARPLNPGPQHDDDFTPAFRKMLRTVRTFELHTPDDVKECYRLALEKRHGSALMVEYAEYYQDARK
jgi:pyruvate/2-oxoglutarate/acetoin dehydrogenase E1 component